MTAEERKQEKKLGLSDGLNYLNRLNTVGAPYACNYKQLKDGLL